MPLFPLKSRTPAHPFVATRAPAFSPAHILLIAAFALACAPIALLMACA